MYIVDLATKPLIDTFNDDERMLTYNKHGTS